MPNFRVPIARHQYDPDPDGPIRFALRASVSLEVATATGTWLAVSKCLLDTGANYTMASTKWAEAWNIAVPDETSTLAMRTASDTKPVIVRDGELRIRFRQLPGRVFRIYCLFSKEYSPDAPLLLGLNNFFDTFRVTIDGRFSPDAPAGHMFFECD